MNKRKTIVFLHLSDMHLSNESDIDDQHIIKIIDSLKTYKDISFKNVVIIISGDITYSGEYYQFRNAFKLVGSLIRGVTEAFRCYCTILTAPGNHDVNHHGQPLDIDYLKNKQYSTIEVLENRKLEDFYNFSKINKCFCSSNIYYDTKLVTLDGISIKVNLINNAIFSTIDQYKGLLYLPDSCINEMSEIGDANFVITVMHHAPDFYRDDIKNKVEDNIIKYSNILFYGHEHYNCRKLESFNGSGFTVLQSGGCLCDNGDWNNSSYIVGLLDVETLVYKHFRYKWNTESNQYEHDEGTISVTKQSKSELKITNDFLDFIHDENEEKYFVFPSIIRHGKESMEGTLVESFNAFADELKEHGYSIIVGSSNIGKTMLLKKLFSYYVKKHYVLYASPEKLLEKSTRKRQNFDKLIKSLFEDIYGANESEWQEFEQSNLEDCIFILDDFEQIDGINIIDFFDSLSDRFGTIIITNTRTIDYDPKNISIEDKETIARYEIKAPVGQKRREIIRKVVKDKASDKCEKNIENIVKQIDWIIKPQLNIIPPEPYYIIQITENFMNNVGEAIYKGTNAFSKVFEANLTNKIEAALKSKIKAKTISIELMYVIFSKIAYFIHFNKAYPIKRSEIEKIVYEYNEDYGKKLITEDIIDIAKTSKIIITSEESSETYRFRNKSILAYFVAKEIIAQNDLEGLLDVVNKACINICTDILLFIIYLSDSASIIRYIIDSINKTIESDSSWSEFSIPNSVPHFISDSQQLSVDSIPSSKSADRKALEKSEEKVEESMVKEFTIKDLYDWDDSVIDTINNRLFKMTSLLQIIAKCLPCFEHLLKKNEKQEVIELMYTLPNRIFMYWCQIIDPDYENIIEELKSHPYLANKKSKMRENDIEIKVKKSFAIYSMNLLLNLYYIPVLNATRKNTVEFLSDIGFFDYSKSPTYQLEHLMFLEQIHDSTDFISTALAMKKESDYKVFSYLLQCIVRHGLITRNDTKENIDRLESKFYPNAKKKLLIERTKNKNSQK